MNKYAKRFIEENIELIENCELEELIDRIYDFSAHVFDHINFYNKLMEMLSVVYPNIERDTLSIRRDVMKKHLKVGLKQNELSIILSQHSHLGFTVPELNELLREIKHS